MKISFQRGVIKREVPEFLAFWKPLLSFILFKWFSKVQFTIFASFTRKKDPTNQHF